MNRAACADYVFDHSAVVDYVSREEFQKEMMHWQLTPIMSNSCVGVFMRKGNEVHAQIDKQYALRNLRKIIRDFMVPALVECGHLTCVALQGSDDIHFLERIGFYRTNEDIQAVYFRLDKLKLY